MKTVVADEFNAIVAYTLNCQMLRFCSLVERDEMAAKEKFAAIRRNFEQAFDL